MPTEEEIAAQKAADEKAAADAAAGPTAEELAAQKAELDQRAALLEQQAQTIAAAQAALAPAPTTQRAPTYRQTIEGAKEFAAKGDPVASALVEQDRAIKVLAAPAEIREDIVREWQRGGYDDVNDARQVVEQRRAGERDKAKDDEIATLKAQLAAKEKQFNAVPGATAREGPAPPDTSKPLSEDEWNRLNAGLSRDERRANQKLLNQGKITIKG